VWGADKAAKIMQERKGKAYEPRVIEIALDYGPRIIAQVENESLWDAVLESEPGPPLTLEEASTGEVLGAFAHFVDLKSPFLHGHSIGVAELVEGAAHVSTALEMDPKQLRWAGLVHDLGRAAVPSGIWNKEGALSDEEWERVRLHPYYTQRILIRCGPLKDLAEVASSHHERMDGSGYHRGSRAPALSVGARLLATADVFRAMTEPRPHRDAFSQSRAAEELNNVCADGRLDISSARCVLEAAGQAGKPARSAWPAGLTDREVEVLRLLTTGLSNKQIARRLTLSPKTVGHHVEHIYAKLEVSTRAGATLFAMEQGLVGVRS
jgi:DNA-binding CsgD family transcriptional regulator